MEEEWRVPQTYKVCSGPDIYALNRAMHADCGEAGACTACIGYVQVGWSMSMQEDCQISVLLKIRALGRHRHNGGVGVSECMERGLWRGLRGGLLALHVCFPAWRQPVHAPRCGRYGVLVAGVCAVSFVNDLFTSVNLC